ncbi:AraC family transcriptional regulator [Chryseobacterium sp. RU33C]|uniref:AraC family transcriptional regulator n=1 Tax=Chryseobacterium sp. RU33C TaxID=1907398 RepID=UPI0011157AD7|nr:AraC family transcriptional regulator [Chryseobacterium sp. RU33C]
MKTIQYIDSHIDEDLSLEKVSELSVYSPFHFHRIFKLVTTGISGFPVTRLSAKLSKSIAYSTRRTFTYEIYHTNFKEHPEGKMVVDFCFPIH